MTDYSLDNLKGGVVALVLAVLVIAAAGLALDSFSSGLQENIVATSVTNETITLTNGTGVSLFSGKCVSGISCTAVHNESTNFVTTATAPNVTISCAGSSITISDNNNPAWGLSSSQLNVTYSCAVGNYQYNVTLEGLGGVANASGYFDTIGTLIGVAALIAIVVGAFYFIKR